MVIDDTSFGAMEFPKGKLNRICGLLKDGQAILDVGCADGALAQQLINEGKKNRLVGIEVDKARALRARRFYQEVILADIEDENAFEAINEKFDVVVFSEVLEHCRTPERILERVKKLIQIGGYTVICLPNVAFWKNRLNLLMGNWNYTEEGILDKTHLRFFTFRTATELIENAGYQIELVLPTHYSIMFSRLYDFLISISPSTFDEQFVFKARA